ncbi:MAG: hypothetical protein R2751_18920 [Bacteroidales bacterium]
MWKFRKAQRRRGHPGAVRESAEEALDAEHCETFASFSVPRGKATT